jgi:hypothetical protein
MIGKVLIEIEGKVSVDCHRVSGTQGFNARKRNYVGFNARKRNYVGFATVATYWEKQLSLHHRQVHVRTA